MFSTADEVLELHPGRGRRVRRRPVLRPAGRHAALQRPGGVRRRGLLHRRPDVRRLLDPRLPGHPRVGHEADPRPGDRVRRPVPGGEDAHHELLDRRPVHRRAVQPRPAQHRGARPRRTSRRPASPTPSYFGPEAEFYVFDDVRFETKQNAGYYYIDSIEGAWNTGRVEEGGNRGYKTRYKGGYFPVPPVDHFADLRDEMVDRARRRRPRGRARAPRGRHRRPGRDQLPVRHAAARRRRADAVQVRHQERRLGRPARR